MSSQPQLSHHHILIEHADFFLVAKPSGLSMHSDANVPGIMVHLEALTGESLYPVHRLDKGTSGVLLVARHHAAASGLSQLFQQRQVQKFYTAIGGNKPKKKQGAIQGDMERSRNGTWKLCETRHNPAVTQFFSHGTGQGVRLFVMKPSTGKTHQLRVALKSLGAPIIGDNRYKGAPAERLMLHATVLEFSWQGELIRGIQHPQEQPDFMPLDWALFPDIARPWTYPWP
ncbi:MAG: TIGR01621 family pseudouridine synthase [Idiomarina sp.]|nr:TIGR01621 family pseudouridine synthase [Idiomarina sp.]